MFLDLCTDCKMYASMDPVLLAVGYMQESYFHNLPINNYEMSHYTSCIKLFKVTDVHKP